MTLQGDAAKSFETKLKDKDDVYTVLEEKLRVQGDAVKSFNVKELEFTEQLKMKDMKLSTFLLQVQQTQLRVDEMECRVKETDKELQQLRTLSKKQSTELTLLNDMMQAERSDRVWLLEKEAERIKDLEHKLGALALTHRETLKQLETDLSTTHTAALEKKNAEFREMIQAKDAAYAALHAEIQENANQQPEEIKSLKELLKKSEMRRLDYSEIVKKKDAIIFGLEASSNQVCLRETMSELEALKVSLSCGEMESLKERLKKSEWDRANHLKLIDDADLEINLKDERVLVLETKLNRLVFERDRLLQSNIQISSLGGLFHVPKPGNKKVKCFMFAFTGEAIRRDIMTDEFKRVSFGKFNENLKYCMIMLFKCQDANTLMEVITRYNRIVGFDFAITPVAVNHELPPILPVNQFPKNPILEKQELDSVGRPADYFSWAN